jgi:hypothetical protein
MSDLEAQVPIPASLYRGRSPATLIIGFESLINLSATQCHYYPRISGKPLSPDAVATAAYSLKRQLNEADTYL